MSSKSPKKRPILVINAYHVAAIHTYLAFTAFLSALAVGCLLHYKKIVKNDVAGYPEEFFPSVSATIGDWYPERNIFQILIALTSGPRFALVFLQYYLTRSTVSSWSTVVFVSGLVRTLSCGGWVYITSYDDHNVHDIFMILYMVMNIPWMLGGIATSSEKNTRRKRSLIAFMFFTSLVPLIYFFIEHKVNRVPGAYTRYSFVEWGLIFFDILYDSIAESDFRESRLQISLGSSLHSNIDNEIKVSSTDVSIKSPPPVKVIVTGAEKMSASKNVSASHWSVIMNVMDGWRPCMHFFSDVYLSYIFWSIFTSLIPTLFYFSVWELGIAGQELALLATLSPILLSIPPFLSWARTRGGLSILHLVSFSGLAAFLLNKPLHRLFVVTFSNVIIVARQAVDWSGVNGESVGYQSLLTGLGLLVSSLSKHANHSNNPIWPFVDENSGGYNKTGLILAFLALYEFYTRSFTTLTPGEQVTVDKTSTVPDGPAAPNEHWVIAAVPLGALIFSLHCFLTDPNTLIAWSWTGFENSQAKGPMPHLHGSLTLLAQALGLLIPIVLSHSPVGINMLSHPLWFIYGSASSAVMYRYKDWIGYAGGLNLSIFLMSMIPLIMQRAALTDAVGKTYFSAWLVWCLFILASVWTVAYAFVPGGVYLRERTDLVLIAQMACLVLAFRWPRLNNRALPVSLSPLARSYSRRILAVLSILSVLVTLYRWPSQSPRPYKAGPRILTAGIWTLHFGFDNEGRDSQRRVKAVINDLQLDVVGFLETDLHRTVFGNRDLTHVIADDLGYYVDIGPGPNSHTWGAALLSKFPIINSTHHLLPSPQGELAPAIEAVLDIYGTPTTIVVAHNGQEQDPLDRELQSTELARIMAASYPRPVIFLGYVVTKPFAPRPAPYDILVTDGKVHDIERDDDDRWCEYILYRGVYRTSYARISRGMVTDTELQVGQFVMPKHGYGVVNDTDDARYLRSWKEDLPKEHWLPMEYYGNENEGGVNGHFYHVFNTPLYYKVPEDAVL